LVSTDNAFVFKEGINLPGEKFVQGQGGEGIPRRRGSATPHKRIPRANAEIAQNPRPYSENMPIKLIIFDLDGTLTDSIADLTDATNTMLAAFGRPELTMREVRKLVGQGARSLVERAMPGAAEGEIESALQVFLDYNDAHIADKTRLYPGVPETLDRLRAGGRQMAVISNKNVLLCRKLLDLLGIGGYFADVLGADSLPFRKPSPEPLLKLLRDFGVAPREAVMVGDSINDVSAGRGAGVVTVGCSYGYGDAEEIAGADYRVAAFPELLELPLFAGC
jgi:phosphoglycolate phosphatase